MAWYGCKQCGRLIAGGGGKPPRCPECNRKARPATDAAGDEPRLATRALRLAGYLWDGVPLAFIMAITTVFAVYAEAAWRRGSITVIYGLITTPVIIGIYWITQTAIWGQTPGKRIAGTQVVGPDGNPPGWLRACIRALVRVFADTLTQICGIGLIDPLWIVWDRQRRTLHDMAAGTAVVVRRRRRATPLLVLGFVVSIGANLGVVLAGLRPFAVASYFVPSGSMEPTLQIDDRLFANKLAYEVGELRRRDVIVFRAPLSAYYSNPQANPDLTEKKDFIKRIVGLPGDEVKVDDGALWVKAPGDAEFVRQVEPFIKDQRVRDDFGPVTVPSGHVIVMGDNRNASNDSTHWIDENGDPAPFLPIENIHGRAFGRFWPPDRIGDISGGE